MMAKNNTVEELEKNILKALEKYRRGGAYSRYLVEDLGVEYNPGYRWFSKALANLVVNGAVIYDRNKNAYLLSKYWRK